MTDAFEAPSLPEIEAHRRRIEGEIVATPMWRWDEPQRDELLGPDGETWFKLELLQRGGSFKLRGVLANLYAHLERARQSGVVAVSAGNHAIAVACAARDLGVHAHVVMLDRSNPLRVRKCREYGAEVELMADVHRAFERARELETGHGRLFIHPFDGIHTVTGTATVGVEIVRAVPDLDVVIVPVGGGGLCAGVARAVKLMRPECRVIAVEPDGADTLRRSMEAGRPEGIEAVRTIADSLGAPYAEAMSFSVCQAHVDRVVLVDDDAIRRCIAILVETAKVAVEPAAAAALAAMLGPARDECRGRKSCAIVCGSNIDARSYSEHLRAGLDVDGQPSRD